MKRVPIGPPPTLANEATPSLPVRLTKSEVCAIARISPATMWRRIKAGRLPLPIDRGRESLFDRDSVLRSLSLKRPDAGHAPTRSTWTLSPAALANFQTRKIKERT